MPQLSALSNTLKTKEGGKGMVSAMRVFRVAKELTLLDLTIALMKKGVQVTPSTLSYWERGYRAPSQAALTALAEVLDASPEVLASEWAERETTD